MREALKTFWNVLYLIFAFSCFLAFVHGIILAFSAHWLLGIVCTLLAQPCIIFAFVYWFTGVNLAPVIVSALPMIF